jgi:hypothetical protein
MDHGRRGRHGVSVVLLVVEDNVTEQENVMMLYMGVLIVLENQCKMKVVTHRTVQVFISPILSHREKYNLFLFCFIMHLLTIPIHFSETTVTLDTGYFLHECIKLVDIFGGKKENVNIFEMIIFFVI